MSVPTGAPVEVGPPLVRIPTDVEYEERVWGPLTVRQAAALAVTGGVLYVRLVAHPRVAADPGVPARCGGGGRAGAGGGHRAPRRPVPGSVDARRAHPPGDHPRGRAPDHRSGPGVAGRPRRPPRPHPRPGAASGSIGEPVREPRRTPRLPPRTIHPANAVSTVGVAGVVDLGPDGYAVLAAADPVDLGLRTPAEQTALIAGFAGLLHALTAGIQILIRAVPLDVAEEADQLLAAAEHLPHPRVGRRRPRPRRIPLRSWPPQHELLRRQVIVILREPRPLPTTPAPTTGRSGRRRGRRRGEPTAAQAVSAMAVQAAYARLARRLGELVDLAAPAGITLHPLHPEQAAAVLAAACHPARGVLAAHLAPPDHVITGPPTTTTRTTGTRGRRRSS